MFKFKSNRIIALVMAMLLIFSTASVFADAGDGNGTGNGENRDIPLTLESASIKDGAAGVAVNETIQLNFNKNICNITVLPTNKAAFHLTDADGNPVAIRLIFPDNQVQREHRHEVFIQPAEDLQPETAYRISVDNTLTAKNGTTIDDAHVIRFTTGSHRTDAVNPVLEKLGDFIVTYETASGENANSVPVNKDGLEDVSEDDGSSAGNLALIAAAALIIILIIFTAVLVITKRRKE